MHERDSATFSRLALSITILGFLRDRFAAGIRELFDAYVGVSAINSGPLSLACPLAFVHIVHLSLSVVEGGIGFTFATGVIFP